MPATGSNREFHALREAILQLVTKIIRKPEPHITLMHPRNSTCTDILFEQIKKCELPDKLQFTKISLIEQEMGKGWNIIKEFELLYS